MVSILFKFLAYLQSFDDPGWPKTGMCVERDGLRCLVVIPCQVNPYEYVICEVDSFLLAFR